MSKGFEYNQVIKQVSSLNSISTLKKWRLKIERLTGHQFEEGQVQTGKRSYSKVYCFTESDIEKLQKIADLKGSIGLNKAILKAYAPTRASPLSVNQRLNRLTLQLNRITQKVTDLTTQEQVLSVRVEQLSHRIEELEKVKRKKLFGK
ncbi:hypothetical protein [Streptococcus mutans]|uniref:hypothetical protein n=1 Tax=Streptococcus mutans TaxID=1309 RepID=UPI0002B52758|nr:hypothetical protein [Streptococcus mutans]EMB80602.1 hypothetical protein SMU52_07598 [Streptococcus mutans NFSM2]MDB8637602.1 hypothetical protein [Streptococcus mutans]NLQ45996.1 hypothetical protein [Streptococcus mutans]